MSLTMNGMCIALCSALLAVSAHAACGGGGYKVSEEPVEAGRRV